MQVLRPDGIPGGTAGERAAGERVLAQKLEHGLPVVHVAAGRVLDWVAHGALGEGVQEGLSDLKIRIDSKKKILPTNSMNS